MHFRWLVPALVFALSPNLSSFAVAQPKTVVVPDVRNLSPGAAKQRLHLRHLKRITGRFFLAKKNWRPELAEGRVYLQTPRPGTRSKPNAVVAVWAFYQANESAKVVVTPRIEGVSAARAKQQLSQAGLTMMSVPVANVPKGLALQPGQVAQQYPQPSQKVIIGTTVLVHVYQPKQPTASAPK